jgi:DNA-binding NarL/FixJ family response regulator
MQPLQLLTKKIRVLLIDNQTIVRSAMRLLIESAPTLKVIGEVGKASEALGIIANEPPDIILFSISAEEELDLLPELMAAAKQARVMILTGRRNPKIHQHAIRLGATGVVSMDTRPKTFLKAIEKVHMGEIWLNRSMTANVLAGFINANQEVDQETAKIATLTKREREVIILIGEGLKNKQISARLFISEATVRHHLTSIFDKLDVSDRLELIIYAYRHALTKPLQ